MKKILFALIILCQYALYAQLPVSSANESLGAESFIGQDNLGNTYFNKENTFYKQRDGKILQYKNISLGKIAHIDLQNPLSIALLYTDFNTVIILDNQLNETRRINFAEYVEPLVITAAGIASQNRLWVYNSLTQQLGLYDYLKNSHVPITQQMKGNIVHYQTDFNSFQWIDDQQYWFSCDIFGKISTFGKVPIFDKVQFVMPKLLYLKNGGLYLFDAVKNTSTAVDLSKKSVLGFWYGQQNLSIFTTEGISNYKITIP